MKPFALSLSKCLFFLADRKERGFDTLSLNGIDG